MSQDQRNALRAEVERSYKQAQAQDGDTRTTGGQEQVYRAGHWWPANSFMAQEERER